MDYPVGGGNSGQDGSSSRNHAWVSEILTAAQGFGRAIAVSLEFETVRE